MYLYKDTHGTVIYVGKAKNLRARVRSYFNVDRLAESKTGTLIHEARNIDFIQVDNEKEALALEDSLIKQWESTRYNILLRDDKTYHLHQAQIRREISPSYAYDAPVAARMCSLHTSALIFQETWRIGW